MLYVSTDPSQYIKLACQLDLISNKILDHNLRVQPLSLMYSFVQTTRILRDISYSHDQVAKIHLSSSAARKSALTLEHSTARHITYFGAVSLSLGVELSLRSRPRSRVLGRELSSLGRCPSVGYATWVA